MAMTRLEICSPEFVAWVAGGSLGKRPSSVANDSWQLGCLLAHLLVDHAPFKYDYHNPKRSLLTAFQGLSDKDAYVAAAKQVQEQHALWVSVCQHPALPSSSLLLPSCPIATRSFLVPMAISVWPPTCPLSSSMTECATC